MKVGFTHWLIRSLVAFLVMGIVLLGFVVYVSSARWADSKDSAQDVFIPERLILWRKTVAIEISKSESQRVDKTPGSPGSTSLGDPATSPAASCPGRGREIFKSRLKLVDSDFDTIFHRSRSILGNELSCARFLEVLEWLSRHPQFFALQDENSLRSLITSASTERVSWNSLPPCFLARSDSGELGLVAGLRARCPNGSLDQSFSTQTRGLGQWIYRRSVSSESVNGRLSAPRQFELSIDSIAQRTLESVFDCVTGTKPNGSCSAIEQRLSRLVGGLSVVLINQSNGAIAAMHCRGTLCEQAGLRGAEPLAPLLAQAPPASTAKVFVALALASSNRPSDRRLIPMQLKTSGQIDDALRKRNEWWERSIICDDTSKATRPSISKGGDRRDKGLQCQIPHKAAEFADQLNFNRGCTGKPNDVQCGRINLGTTRSSLPGFLGRFSPATKKGFGPYLNWSAYELVRSGKASVPPAPLDLAYLRTSRAVQSAIGAGESRVSALGLAHLSGQVVGQSLGFAQTLPWLIREIRASTDKEEANRNSPVQNPIPITTLEPVVSGMRKVMRAVEPGWEGNGTAYSAVNLVWGPSVCGADCPIWGKTGTVGLADRVFGRTTLFSGAFHLKPLRDALVKQAISESSSVRDGIWSVGAIAMPKQGVNQSEGHLASQLSLVIIDRLIRDGAGQK